MADMCGAERTKKFDIPLSHLDYNYLEKCGDLKELEKILKVLRSGEEGRYPDLERVCEEKICHLNPDSRLLRKEKPPALPGDLEHGQWEKISDGLKDWAEEMKEREESAGKGSAAVVDGDLPPVRGSGVQISADSTNKSNNGKQQATSKPVKPRDYREWDKFDVEKELKSVEQEEKSPLKGVSNTLKQTTLPQNLKTDVDVKGLSEEEKTLKANREKDKGNEAFRSSDYLEAVVYYTRSIHCVPLPASYNNRALAYLKLSKWSEAISDCNRVLTEETENVKAILRRGTAYKGLKEYKKAQRDFETVLELESNNKRAKDLLAELGKDKDKDEHSKEERKQKGRRMTIEEVEGSESENEEADTATDINTPSTTTTDSCSGLLNGCSENSLMDTGETVEENNSNDTSKTQTEGESEHGETKTESETITENETKTESQNETIESSSEDTEKSGENTKSDVTDGNVLSNSKTVDTESPAAQLMARPVLTQHPLLPPVGELRESGNTLFRSGQYGDAIAKYSTAIDLLVKGGTEQTVNLSLLHSNRAACKLKVGDCVGTIEDCTEALKLVPHSVKPLLRRAQAHETTERYRKAYVDFKHVLSIDSSYDIAFQGANRCSRMLQEQDGPKWREKLPDLPRVLISDVPVINTTSSPYSVSPSPVLSPSSPLPPANTVPPTSTSDNIESHSSEAAEDTMQSNWKALSPDEQFDKKKGEGNQYVQKGEFRLAEDCYSSCIKLFPDRPVAFTNRALCYLRLNEATKAEEDCTRALTMDSQNVKALFRRAQAKKMLGQYKDSLSDLSHLLRLDSKNSAAKRELDVVKQYYRQELEKLKANPSDKTEVSDSVSPSDTSTKKQRKRLVIEEVEGDTSDSTESNDTKTSEILKEKKLDTTSQAKVSEAEVKSKTKSSSAQGNPTKDTAKDNTSNSGKTSAKTARVPKLIKVTPYEFMQAWNSLKSVKGAEAYGQLLDQVPPDDIAAVISNKLDADMLSKIIACATEYFIPKGQSDLAYRILTNLCKVPRFQTMVMFLSTQEKQDLSSLFDTLGERLSDAEADIEKLRVNYGLKS